LDPNWARTTDILPGMVCTRLAGEVFTLASTTTHKGFGLSALFVAPVLGIDELKSSGTNNFAVCVGGNDAEFEVLAPAFDSTADLSAPTDGSRKILSHTLTAHAQGAGKLTVSGGSNAASNPVAELVEYVSPAKIKVRLNTVA